MSKMKKKSLSLILIMLIAIMYSMPVFASGVSYSYSLRQLSGVPSSSNVYVQEYGFTAAATTTTMTCTQNTTAGANVIAISSNGIQAYLNTQGASASASATVGRAVVTKVTLSVPNSYNTYTGYGTITG